MKSISRLVILIGGLVFMLAMDAAGEPGHTSEMIDAILKDARTIEAEVFEDQILKPLASLEERIKIAQYNFNLPPKQSLESTEAYNHRIQSNYDLKLPKMILYETAMQYMQRIRPELEKQMALAAALREEGNAIIDHLLDIRSSIISVQNEHYEADSQYYDATLQLPALGLEGHGSAWAGSYGFVDQAAENLWAVYEYRLLNNTFILDLRCQLTPAMARKFSQLLKNETTRVSLIGKLVTVGFEPEFVIIRQADRPLFYFQKTGSIKNRLTDDPATGSILPVASTP